MCSLASRFLSFLAHVGPPFKQFRVSGNHDRTVHEGLQTVVPCGIFGQSL